MLDPNGVALRLSPLPNKQGTVWQMAPVYQKKVPSITTLSQTLSPIPDESISVFRQGFLAYCYRAADSPRYENEYMSFLAQIQKEVGAADREQDNYSAYPSRGLMSGPAVANIPGDGSGPFPWGY